MHSALLKAGAAAAAVASIIGVVVTVIGLWPEGRAAPDVIIELGEPEVSEPMPYKTFAKLVDYRTDRLSTEDLAVRGVKVDYRARVTGAPKNTAFQTRITLRKLGTDAVYVEEGEGFRTTQDPDVFVLHSFVYSRGPGRYKLTVEVPDPTGSASKDSTESREFAFVASAT